jgi:alpha-amylase
MVDVVANHTGPIGMDFSQINPLNQAEYYHDDCQINDWANQTEVEYCRLADLPDLDQDNSFTRTYLKNWVKNLVADYDFDGIRIDTIPEVGKDFWKEYGEAAGVFQMGECFNGDPAYVGPYQDSITALFNYPMYYTISDVFGNGDSFIKVSNRYSVENLAFTDVDALGVFVDNHDNARFLCNHPYQNAQLAAATVFSLTTRGIPFVYYGTEQYYSGCSDPENRESLWNDMNTDSDLYLTIQRVNQQRKSQQIWNEQWVDRYHSQNFFAFSRGEFLVALTNSDSQ